MMMTTSNDKIACPSRIPVSIVLNKRSDIVACLWKVRELFVP